MSLEHLLRTRWEATHLPIYIQGCTERVFVYLRFEHFVCAYGHAKPISEDLPPICLIARSNILTRLKKMQEIGAN